MLGYILESFISIVLIADVSYLNFVLHVRKRSAEKPAVSRIFCGKHFLMGKNIPVIIVYSFFYFLFSLPQFSEKVIPMSEPGCEV